MRALIVLCLFICIMSCDRQASNSEAGDTRKSVGAACAPTLIGEYLTDKPAPMIPGLDYFDFPITHKGDKAQKYFNQGWALAAGFNHAEAARSFYWATQEDPDCAMCYWGLSYALGPNYNAGMDPAVVSDAVESIKVAQLLSSTCTERERGLIEAMAARYPEKHTGDRSAFDLAYKEALGDLHKKYPQDNDIAAMYVESIMDLHPWDLWDKQGNPKEWTNEILQILSDVRQRDPDHAIANHLYIHSVEASFEPEMGNEAANRLADIAPGAGHLVHMPSHIYIRTGEYRKCADANVEAVNVDSVYVSACHAAGAYPLGYYPHNFHFLCACEALTGNGQMAYDASIRMQEKLDTEIMREEGWGTIQHYFSIPYYIMIKFEMWDDILATPMNDDELIYPNAILQYARGMAFANTNQLNKAIQALAMVKSAAADTAMESITIWDINPVSDLLNIAYRVLESEISHKGGNSGEAVLLLQEAVAIEDGLNYNEPPDWFFSVRHYLGSVLLETDKYAEAEAVYRKDLFNYPDNGWALNGLKEALMNQGKTDQAKQVNLEFNRAWEAADVTLNGSRVSL